MVELTALYESRTEEDHTYKKKKGREIPEPDKRAKRCRLQSRCDARGFIGSSVYDLLTKLSICGNKRTKDLKLLDEIAENSSRWNWCRWNERWLHRD